MSNSRLRQKKSSIAYQSKLAVHKRDKYTCKNCLESFNDASHLDADHSVPRGQGGSNVIQNKSSLCRICHKAKHKERDHARTVRFESTGDMPDKEFDWFVNFWKHQLPALSTLPVNYSYEMQPKFNLAESKSYSAWHIPLGDLRKLDQALSDIDGLDYERLQNRDAFN
jgi:HNH endonuclease.